MLRNILLCSILSFVFIISFENVQAHQGRGKLWLGINGQRNFYEKTKKNCCEETNWLWAFYPQVRFTHQLRPFESVFVEPLLGYKLDDYSTLE